MLEEHPLLAELAHQARSDYESHQYEADLGTWLREKVEKDPYKYTRTAFQLLNDMLEHFGTEEKWDAGEKFRRFKLFDDPFNAGQRAVFGLERTSARLGAFIRAAAREEGKERIFVLVGPVGTAKTTMVDLISRGLEHYSATEAGESFRISWRFPRSLEDEVGSLGFVRTGPDESKEIFAQVPCQMRDNPLLLIPRPERRKYLDSLFAKAYPEGKKRPVVPKKILEGALCYNCAQIYGFLMRKYRGDWTKAVQRVVVERFLFSELKGMGIGKVLPEGNIDSSSTFVAFDENYKALSMLLAEVNLVKFNGKYVMANRGLMHYSDIFKRPVAYLQHLLSAVEEHRIDFGEVGADIDVVIVGTTNTPEYHIFRQDILSRGIQSRMRKIEVPYLLNYTDEEKIYGQGLREVARTRHVTPHTTTLAALWAVLTRLLGTELHESGELSVAERRAVKALSPIEKALVYAGELPKTLSKEDREAFTPELVRKLRNEYPREGMEGISPRIVQNIFADICETSEYRCVTPFEFIKKMNRLLTEKSELQENLQIESEGEGGAPEAYLDAVNKRYNVLISSELKSSLIDVSGEELDRKIHAYLTHVTAHLKKEKILSRLPGGKPADPDESLMRFVEEKMGVSDEDREDFRFKMLSRATAAVKGGAALDIPETYKDLYSSVVEGMFEEKRSQIKWSSLRAAVEKTGRPEERAEVDSSTAEAARTLLRNMVEKYGYCQHCARYVALYAIDNKLIE